MNALGLAFAALLKAYPNAPAVLDSERVVILPRAGLTLIITRWSSELLRLTDNGDTADFGRHDVAALLETSSLAHVGDKLVDYVPVDQVVESAARFVDVFDRAVERWNGRAA